MKKPILILALLAVTTISFSQQRLPSKISITLSDRQILRIDSAINIAATQADSKQFTNWFISSFKPLYDEIKSQMIIDTSKAKQIIAPKKK